MAVSITTFDRLNDGNVVEKVTLQNSCGTAVSILTLGATIQSFLFDDKDIVLGFERAQDYFDSGAYIGATVGRVCNRTADGRFDLNGTTYRLCCNETDRRVHLHGGACGFDKKIWDCTVLSDEEEPAVSFEVSSEDGDEGYPGNLRVRLVYTLKEDNTLNLDYTAATDKDTPVNLTNHVYFNLNGCDGDAVHNHFLKICAAYAR